MAIWEGVGHRTNQGGVGAEAEVAVAHEIDMAGLVTARGAKAEEEPETKGLALEIEDVQNREIGVHGLRIGEVDPKIAGAREVVVASVKVVVVIVGAIAEKEVQAEM